MCAVLLIVLKCGSFLFRPEIMRLKTALLCDDKENHGDDPENEAGTGTSFNTVFDMEEFGRPKRMLWVKFQMA